MIGVTLPNTAQQADDGVSSTDTSSPGDPAFPGPQGGASFLPAGLVSFTAHGLGAEISLLKTLPLQLCQIHLERQRDLQSIFPWAGLVLDKLAVLHPATGGRGWQ